MSITYSTQREECIMQLLATFAPHIKKQATYWHCDYDDFYQEASMLILAYVDNPTVARADLPRYINRAIRFRLYTIGSRARKRETLSLDAPVGETTFADLLPSGYSVDPAALYATRERIIELGRELANIRGKRGSSLRSLHETATAIYC